MLSQTIEYRPNTHNFTHSRDVAYGYLLDLYVLLHTAGLELYRIGVESRLKNETTYDDCACRGHGSSVVKYALELKSYLKLQGYTTTEGTKAEPLAITLLQIHKLVSKLTLDNYELDSPVSKWLNNLQSYLGTLAHFEAASVRKN